MPLPHLYLLPDGYRHYNRYRLSGRMCYKGINQLLHKVVGLVTQSTTTRAFGIIDFMELSGVDSSLGPHHILGVASHVGSVPYFGPAREWSVRGPKVGKLPSALFFTNQKLRPNEHHGRLVRRLIASSNWLNRKTEILPLQTRAERTQPCGNDAFRWSDGYFILARDRRQEPSRCNSSNDEWLCDDLGFWVSRISKLP